MLLYHYSPESLSSLKTPLARGGLDADKIKRADEMAVFRGAVAPYYKHISFFFDPIPADILGNLFSKHPNAKWKTGDVYYEHIVDSDTFGAFKYQVVEVEHLQQADKLVWPGDDASDDKKKAYFKMRYDRNIKLGLVGVTNDKFDAVCSQFVGGTRRAFIKATQNPATPDSLTLYAADVPHVMVYPERGIIPVVKTPNKIKIGAGKFTLEGVGFSLPKPSSRW